MINLIILILLLCTPSYAQEFEDKGDKFEQALLADVDSGSSKVIFDKTKQEITLSKWDNQSAVKISYLDLQSSTGDAVGDKVTWDGQKQAVNSYVKDDGSLEIEVVLKEKPLTNVFNFSITGADDLDFFYQLPLWQENGLKESNDKCNDTYCDDGNAKSFRPENVVGSYAVYHKFFKDHIEGKTNYGIGKAYHIYRPKVTDANGGEIWGDLSYTNGALSITVPQNFLDLAAYPVIVDPTFGNTATGVTLRETGGGRIDGGKFTLSGTGTPSSITAYGGDSGGSPHNRYAIYDASSPANYKMETSGVAITAPYNVPAWSSNASVTVPISLTAGDYWLYLNNDSDWYWSYDSGGSGTDSYGGGLVYGDPWPATVTPSFVGVLLLSIYCNYTAAVTSHANLIQGVSLIRGVSLIN